MAALLGLLRSFSSIPKIAYSCLLYYPAEMLKLVLYNQLKLRLELRLKLVIEDELEHHCWVVQLTAACADSVLVACVNISPQFLVSIVLASVNEAQGNDRGNCQQLNTHHCYTCSL